MVAFLAGKVKINAPPDAGEVSRSQPNLAGPAPIGLAARPHVMIVAFSFFNADPIVGKVAR